MYTSRFSSLKAPHQTDILIVDDTVENLVFLSNVLETAGYLVRKARNGKMALRAVQDAVPDLILLDIRMPDLDGYEVCQHLKANARTAQVPIMFLSALDDVADKVKAFEVGASDYMTKPFQVDEVLVRTQNQLLLKSALHEVNQLNQRLEDKVRQRTRQLERANSQLMEMAYHDDLTGLPNRALLTECLARSLESIQNDAEYQFALMFLDCDRFKLVNDSFGHAVGDALLVEVARRLSVCIGPEDTLARFSGDEFVVLINQVSGLEETEAIAQSLLDSLKPSFRISDREIFINASVGIVISDTQPYSTPEHMLRDADTAMYSAKKQGKARYRFFTPAMQQASAQLLQIETELHRAIQRREIVPYYQPIVDLQTQAIVGAEVLCRWLHPERGLLTPNFFIPIAEETQLIVELSYMLLENTCAQLQRWQAQNIVGDRFYISFNVSACQLAQADFPTHVAAYLARYGLKAHHLHLEITESGILDNETAGEVMYRLQQQGIRLSVDDFGTGYSSLSYLHKLPVNTLKIDRAFIQDVDSSSRNSGIVAAIIGIAQALKLDVISEGIDNPEQIKYLQQLNCQFGQGFLFSKPLPADDIQMLFAQKHRVHAFPSHDQRAALPAFSEI